jgi:hypothetical protein
VHTTCATAVPHEMLPCLELLSNSHASQVVDSWYQISNINRCPSTSNSTILTLSWPDTHDTCMHWRFLHIFQCCEREGYRARQTQREGKWWVGAAVALKTMCPHLFQCPLLSCTGTFRQLCWQRSRRRWRENGRVYARGRACFGLQLWCHCSATTAMTDADELGLRFYLLWHFPFPLSVFVPSEYTTSK